MATYSTLRRGSKGDEVKELQTKLISSGYSVGNTGADGIYGANTEAAVKKYQTDNGLKADGIAGNQTFSKLYGKSANPSAASSTASGTQNVNTSSSLAPEADSAYMQALSTLQSVQKNAPTYKDSYSSQLQDIYNQIVNREKFSYDVNNDALYQQYRDQYVRQGQLAMEDAIGQAAALTGGYGNSYAQSVGQQTYQNYLGQLNDVVPELYGLALDRYNQEGQDLLNQYAMLGELADDEFAKYQADLQKYWNDLEIAREDENTAYNRAETAKANTYNRVMGLVESGYVPSNEELSAVGLTSAQANHIKKSAEAYTVALEAEDEGTLFGEYSAKEFYEAMQAAASMGSEEDAKALVASAGYSDAAWELYEIYFGQDASGVVGDSGKSAARDFLGNVVGDRWTSLLPPDFLD